MASIIFSDEAPQDLKQLFTDKETGQYDIAKAQQWWAQVKKLKNEEQKKAINSQLIDPMRLNSLYTKYTSMISGSIYICLLYTSPSPRDGLLSRMPSSA